ncbi:type I polyketide synthase [Streptomyces mesophilus]|uniref:type I polyketide synthase n=1 Tax=Streptomyces mesophilus TaxID=1775132 RepID=UPI0033200ED0
MSRDPSFDIAVTGVAARFPGPADLGEWWEAVLDGQVFTTMLTRDALIAAGLEPSVVDDPRYVPVRGLLPDADRFDHEFFGMSRREAQLTDPQQRLALEVAWQALEDSGVNPYGDVRRTAVFASCTGSGYLRAILGRGPVDPAMLDDLIHGSEPDFMASRISYKLGLTGPALAVQTACSSSLVGVHLAVQSLLNGDCDQALVVATGMGFPQGGHLALHGGVLSPSGNCRPFCGTADGVVAGSGAACVVLRRAEDAVLDGVVPHGVILGSAFNNDGSAKAGYYAPSVRGQQEVIRSALAAAQVGAESIGYLETHGTGTPIGDPIEWEAASSVLSDGGTRRQQTAVGAVKANVGHLDACAGLAALVKALLVLKTGEIPPVAGFQKLNPLLESSCSPLYVPTERTPWQGPAGPRRAGVSAFGIGGTNVHVVLEQPAVAAAPDRTDAGRPRVLALSAGDGSALQALTEATARALEAAGMSVTDAACTLARGRAPLKHRRAVVATAADTGARLLRERSEGVHGIVPTDGPGPLLLLFPGQGTQSPGMALPYQEALPGFREELGRCLDHLPGPLRARVHTALVDPSFDAGALDETALAQPALVCTQIAAAAALGALGVRPDGVVGHSLGELAAAVVAGLLTAQEAVGLAVVRGRAMQACPAGAMLALGCDVERAHELIAGTGVDLAAVNAPAACVVAGSVPEIEQFAAALPTGLVHRRLRTTRAFHSRLVDACLGELEDEASGLARRAAVLPFASSALGRVLGEGEELDPSVWSAGARSTVLFHEAWVALAEVLPGAGALEVGPGRTLTPAVAAHEVPCATLGGAPGDTDPVPVLRGLADLWAAGRPVDLAALAGDGAPARLPVHPFRGPVHRAPELSGVAAEWSRGQPAPSCGEPAPASVGAEGDRSGAGDEVAAVPAPDVEHLVASAWRVCLGLDEVDADSDFFVLGGDSLLITRLIGRLGNELGMRLPVRAMLAARTLGGQTEVVRQAVRAG